MQKIEIIENIHTIIAPQIIGNVLAKKILALQLFSNPLQDEKIHIMLIGDPASGKSFILKDISDVSPNSSFLGKKTTAVGLIERIVGSDGGIACIDEFDKIPRFIRDSLLECMQTGKIEINQHNIHVSYNARTNLAVACNPRGYILLDNVPAHKQTVFTPAELSRFHFIIPFKAVDSDYYTDIVRAHESTIIENDVQRKKMLLSYVIKVRQEFPFIRIPEYLWEEIGKFAKELGDFSKLKEIISPRTLEGLRSTVRAAARMNMHREATKEDFEYVKRLYELIYMNLEE